MTDEHPVVERYLARLESHLASLSPADRQDVLTDIRSHLAEAVAAGRSLDTALASLGPADELARGYSVELLMNPRGARPRGSGTSRFLKLAGLVVIGSIPTLVIVIVLSAVGVSFTFAGLAVLAAGLLAAVGELPPWIHMDLPPIFAILLGPVMTAAGILSLAVLVLYIKFLAFAVRRVLPDR